jgi:2-keto-4-pentenoate hydratase/2-oxohepta-3-ene-1,7-dioic acid hydratase in catechol pathway
MVGISPGGYGRVRGRSITIGYRSCTAVEPGAAVGSPGMRLLMFDDHRIGVATDAGVIDLTDLVGEGIPPRDRMTALITAWDGLFSELERAVASRPALGRDTVVVRAPQPHPSKIIAAPVNYRLHQEEMGGEHGVYEGATIADIDTYAGFVEAPSSIIGPDGAIELPFRDRRVDYEGELGVVIGRRASRVSRAQALGHVFGYVPLLDITMRGEEDRSFRKSFDTFTPIGPEIVTADEVGDIASLELELRLNGDVRQRASMSDLIHDVPRLIARYSEVIALEPGDLIATGTPDGVGPLAPGDEIDLSIGRIGRLRMSVVARDG